MLNFDLDFHKIGGFCIFRPCLDSAHGSLRWRAAEIIAELTQNNPYCQERVLEAGLLPVLLSLVDVDHNQQVQIKALYALSCKLLLDTIGFQIHQVKQMYIFMIFVGIQNACYTRRIFTLLTSSKALHFTVTIVPPAARQIRILLMS